MDELIKRGYKRDICPITTAMEAIGDSWSLLIVRECFLGFRRFEDFRKNLGMSKSVLTRKLRAMLEHDVLLTRQYRENGQRSRSEYLLTERGKELYKIVIALIEWGNLSVRTNEPKLAVFDRLTGQQAKLILRTSDDRELGRRDIRLGLLEE